MINNLPQCLICGEHLQVNLARGRKSGKAFVMLICPRDGRHFRGFISHKPYVEQLLANLETIQQSKEFQQ